MRARFILALDVGLICAGSILALFARGNFEYNQVLFDAFRPYLIITAVIATAVLGASRTNERIWRYSSASDYLAIVWSVAIIIVLSLFVCFTYNRLVDIARGLPVIQFVFASGLLIVSRQLYRAYRSQRTEAKAIAIADPVEVQTAVVLIGLNSITELYVKCARTYAPKRVALAGVVLLRPRATGQAAFGVPILGTIDDLSAIFDELMVRGIFVDRLVVTVERQELSEAQRVQLRDIEDAGEISVEYFSERWEPTKGQKRDEINPATNAGTISNVTRATLSDIQAATLRPYWAFKRLMDLVVAGIIAVPAFLVICVTACAAVVLLGWPVVFWQFRPGRGGQAFKVYKLRTLRPAMDDLGRRVPEAARTTTFGTFLRTLRLDELPQVFSVLTGSMSLVGPRPLILSEQARYPAARLLVRPGITGWAQVNGGRNLSDEDKLALDLWYIKNASFWIDLVIIARTAKMLISGEQASDQDINAARAEIGLEPGYDFAVARGQLKSHASMKTPAI